MKKTTLKMIAASLALLFLLALAAGCAERIDTPETTPAATNAESSPEPVAEETTSLSAMGVLGPRDFGKEKVTFYSSAYSGVWSTDLFYETMDGDILGSAVFTRNARISDQYNVQLSEIKSGKKSFNDQIESKIKAGDDSFQLLYLGLSDAAKGAAAGLLMNLVNVQNINLSGPWWTQSDNAAWSIGGRQYFATGDITTIDNMAIRMMYFNKSIRTDLNLESPYKLVENNEWVFDKFFEMVAAAGSDVSGNGATEDDNFGVVAQTTFGFMMTMASGEILVKKDNADLPVIAVVENADRFIEVTSYLTDKISSNSCVWLADDKVIMGIFSSGRSLFMAEVLQHAKTMRQNYDIDFGLLPMPKYNKDQESYYQYTTGYCTTVVGIPSHMTGAMLDRASFIMEAMAIESVETVTPAYYEICLKGRYVDDTESAAMIDIITSSVQSDLAEIYNWGDLKNKVQSAISSGASISTTIRSVKKLTENAIKQTVEQITALP